MKIRVSFISLILLCLTLSAVPTLAQTVYDNGPANGNTDAWTVNFGFVVSDTLSCCREPGGPGTITGFSFNAWLLPGDNLTSAELSITSAEDGGTSFFDSTVNFTQGTCSSNTFGFNICLESSTFSGPSLGAGTYWVNLQNASVPSGDPVYWDENSGVDCGGMGCPSQASENSVGTIPSESFTLYGTTGTTGTTSTTSTTSTTGTVPEPSSIMLFGTGLLGVCGWLRRKL